MNECLGRKKKIRDAWKKWKKLKVWINLGNKQKWRRNRKKEEEKSW